MRTNWIFSISYYNGEAVAQPMSIGVQLSTPREVEEFADFLGFDIPGRNNPNHHSRGVRVNLPEDDPRLHTVLQRIETRYGWKPRNWAGIPLEDRARFFGIRKNREYTKKDLDGEAFLCLFANKCIAKSKDGNADQVDKEIYVAAADRMLSSKIQFGALCPFQGKCITKPLGQQLEDAGLRGLSLEPVVFVPPDNIKKPLLKLSSTFIAPRSLLPMVDELGHQIEPNTEWACYYLDDGGYEAIEFKYRQSDMKQFEAVDIAMSYERTGPTKARAYRWCIVSQRFRQVMAALKVPGVSYAPVRFVPE